MAEITETPDGETSHVNQVATALAGRVRALRYQRGLSLRDLAMGTGISHAMLGQIETGRVRPSLATLSRLAQVFVVPLADLFSDTPSAAERVVRRHERRPLPCATPGVTDWMLTPDSRGAYLVFHSTLPPGFDSGEPLAHPSGQQVVYILSGQVTYEIDGQTHTLYDGDTITFDSGLPHRAHNPSHGPTELLWVVEQAKHHHAEPPPSRE